MSGFAGFGLYGLVPIGIQATIDQNPHVPESITTTLIYLIAQGLSVVFTYVMIVFYLVIGVSGMWLATFLTFASYFALILAYREKFVRKYKEKNEKFVRSLKCLLNEKVI
jgi:Na+-driven multidrug efflux pump